MHINGFDLSAADLFSYYFFIVGPALNMKGGHLKGMPYLIAVRAEEIEDCR